MASTLQHLSSFTVKRQKRLVAEFMIHVSVERVAVRNAESTRQERKANSTGTPRLLLYAVLSLTPSRLHSFEQLQVSCPCFYRPFQPPPLESVGLVASSPRSTPCEDRLYRRRPSTQQQPGESEASSSSRGDVPREAPRRTGDDGWTAERSARVKRLAFCPPRFLHLGSPFALY